MMNNDEEVIATMALTRIAGVGAITAHRLLSELGSAREIFAHPHDFLEVMPTATPRLAELLTHSAEAFSWAEKEYAFAEKGGISCLSYFDPNYPSRLRQCEDAPAMLYFRGEGDLNALKLISIVGTRKATQYGRELCEHFVADLLELYPELIVVSGLAYGIDICAHRAVLQQNGSTVAVLAHGLDRIYPSAHRNTAIQLLEKGGLLTEFPSGTNPDRPNFVQRNRIVAGMTDATLVIESAAKGGSLITAELAQGYGRDCFAFPGRIGDVESEGCNRLIASNAAQLLTSAKDFALAMGWKLPNEKKLSAPMQCELFEKLTPEEQRIVSLLRTRGDLQLNILVTETDLPVYRLSAVLLDLEMKGLIKPLQGAMYHLLRR